MYILNVPSDPDPYITVAQAAELLDVTGQTVRNLIAAGELPNWHKISEAVQAPFVGPRSDIDAYLARQQKKKKSA